VNAFDQLIVWMASYGMTFTLCDAKILQRPRDWLVGRSKFWQELVECYFCTGFWVSFFVGLGRFYGGEPVQTIKQVVLHSFAGATFCFFFDSLLRTLESNDRNHPKE
jgi:hypothetical protein